MLLEFFCTDCLRTCQVVGWGAWNVTLPLGQYFGSRRWYTQICPWIFWETRRLLVVNWPRWWDLLDMYYAPKCSMGVSKLSMDLGGNPPYQINFVPLRDIGKTRQKIASSLVCRFAWVRKASKYSSGSMVPSYRSRLSGFHPKGMSASIM